MLRIIIVIAIFALAVPFCTKKAKQTKNYTNQKIEEIKEEIDKTEVIKDVAKKTFNYGKDND